MLPKQIEEKLDSFKEQINHANTIALFGHESIDPDSLGAMLGLGNIFERLGKRVTYYTTTPPSESNGFMDGIEKIQTVFDYGKYDLVCFIDFSSYERILGMTRNHEEYFNNAKKIIIDHHIETEEKPNSFILRDIESSSTCGLCYEITSLLWKDMLDGRNATLRYTGLLTDTGNFMRSKNAKRDYSIAGSLIDLGADKEKVIRNLYYSSHDGLIEMTRTVFERAKISGDIVYTWYTQEELDTFGVSDDEIEKAHMLLRSIENIPIFLRLRKDFNQRKGSLRSGRDKDGNRYNVESIASSFPTGGGHVYASGFSVDVVSELGLEDNVQQILQQVQTQIDSQKNNKNTF